MIRQELNLIPLYLVIGVLMPWTGPVGGEIGWRGFALPRLQSAYSPQLASLVIGSIWGIWHLPEFFAQMGGPWASLVPRTFDIHQFKYSGGFIVSWKRGELT